jgi:hypothetical protein
MIWVFQQLPQRGIPYLEDLSNFVKIYLLIPVTLPSSFTAHVTKFHGILDVLFNSGCISNHATRGSPPGISGIEEVSELVDSV